MNLKRLSNTLFRATFFLYLACFNMVSNADNRAPSPRTALRLESANDTHEINSYYSTENHGATRKFFEFYPERAVIEAYISNKALPLKVQMKIVLFDQTAAPQSISHWINNQHSDGIYIDAAKPRKTIQLNERQVHAITRGPLPKGSEESEQLYDKYEVTFYVQDYNNGDVSIAASQSSAMVFVKK